MIFKQISVFFLSVLLFAIFTSEVLAQSSLPGLKVSDNKRFLVTETGQPFYWQADTAWQLQRATPAEVVTYMNDRASKGFTVIQGPTLTGDTDVKSGTNYRGDRNDNPSSPNAAWFEHIDYIIDQATNRGMYVAPVVIWATQQNRISSTTQAYNYGVWLGTKYRNYNNIIWIVAGEYAAGPLDSNTLNKWKQLAQGLKDGSQNRHLVTIHGSWGPNDADRTSSTYFHNESWLDFNMWQTSQDPWKESWPLITSDYNKTPTKPVVDGEPTYEGWWEVTNYNFNGLGTRRRAYWAVFAGAFGYTYGAHGIWDWHKPGESSTTGDQWSVALNFEGSADMQHVKNLILSRPFLTRIPDQGLIVGGAGSGWDHMHATRDSSGSYAFVYVPNPNQNITIDTSKLTGNTLRVWWYNARTASASDQGTINRTGGSYTFTSPSGGDSVLVIDDASKGYGAPGVVSSQSTASPTSAPTIAPTAVPASPTPLTPSPTQGTQLPGDANNDGKVDGVDYIVWLGNYGANISGGPIVGDFNSDQRVDGLDYIIWLTNYDISTPASIATPTPIPTDSVSKPGWVLTFSDEFNGNSLDRVTSANPNGKWFTRYIYDNGNLDFLNNELQRYRENNQTHQVSNGTLKLIARKVTGTGYQYESGMIRSNFSQKNGYFEARIKVPKGQGTWPAFWLNPQDQNWPPEIDVFEFFNRSAGSSSIYNPYTSHHQTHPSDEQPAPVFIGQNMVEDWTGNRAAYKPGFNFGDNFHIYAAEWDTSQVKFYIDDTHILTRSYSWKHSNGSDGGPAHVLLNLAMGDQGGQVDESSLPQIMEIDYVRVYRK